MRTQFAPWKASLWPRLVFFSTWCATVGQLSAYYCQERGWTLQLGKAARAWYTDTVTVMRPQPQGRLPMTKDSIHC